MFKCTVVLKAMKLSTSRQKDMEHKALPAASHQLSGPRRAVASSPTTFKQLIIALPLVLRENDYDYH